MKRNLFASLSILILLVLTSCHTSGSSSSSSFNNNNSSSLNGSSSSSSASNNNKLELIITDKTSLTLMQDKTFNIDELLLISFNPSEPDSKEVIFTSEDENIFTISGNTITTHEVGKSNLVITSKIYSDIFTKVEVNVEVEKFTISYSPSENYKVNGLKDSYSYDEQVTFSIELLNENFVVKEVKANEDILSTDGKGKYTFKMPHKNVILNIALENKAITNNSCTYNVIYDLGSGKTAKQLTTSEAILNSLSQEGEETIISNISSFEYIYGGGNGGRGDTLWVSNNMLKVGTTSKYGSLTIELTKSVDSIVITGYIHQTKTKIKVGDSLSSDWLGETLDNKTTEVTCSDMTVIDKTNVESNNVSSVKVKFESTKSLKIAVTGKGPLYITSLTFNTVNENIVYHNVTWCNDDGQILKIDSVKEGLIPSYGLEPIKLPDDDYIYVFSGWNPAPKPIYSDVTYAATYTKYDKTIELTPSVPTITNGGKNIEFGLYPLNHVSDSSLISSIETSGVLLSSGYYSFNNNYYKKITASTYLGASYTFDDGSAIVNGNEYWFKCEKISWNVLKKVNNTYTLISTYLLDNVLYNNDYEYDGSFSPNNYENSDIRKWLTSFIQSANLNEDYLLTTEVDNSSKATATSSNPYAGSTTLDKVYLPSYADMNSAEYGFIDDNSRVAKTSEYVRTKGAWMNNGEKNTSLKYNGSYWTRSPSSEYYYTAWNVNSSGYLSDYAIDVAGHSVRPMITISLK